jgi:hypothetical protein
MGQETRARESKRSPCEWTSLYGLLVCRTEHLETSYERVGSFELDEVDGRSHVGRIVDEIEVKEVIIY